MKATKAAIDETVAGMTEKQREAFQKKVAASQTTEAPTP
jgi:hypothetical protein